MCGRWLPHWCPMPSWWLLPCFNFKSKDDSPAQTIDWPFTNLQSQRSRASTPEQGAVRSLSSSSSYVGEWRKRLSWGRQSEASSSNSLISLGRWRSTKIMHAQTCPVDSWQGQDTMIPSNACSSPFSQGSSAFQPSSQGSSPFSQGSSAFQASSNDDSLYSSTTSSTLIPSRTLSVMHRRISQRLDMEAETEPEDTCHIQPLPGLQPFNEHF
jgi:hypothetical protein